jgi:long-chain acyl-CoA synthetase
LVRINPVTGDLIWTGYAKDTILLSNGENVESNHWKMLTGQYGRRLVAILVLSPTELADLGYLSESEVVKLYLLPNP